MQINSFKFRYLNYACYELRLPNDKVIIIDPCIDINGQYDTFKPENYSKPDYILLSHTHYDHTMDVGYLAAKYQPKVIVGAMSCYPLLTYYDLNFDSVYPVTPGERFDFPDFRLEVFRSKHTFMNNPDNVLSKRIAGIEGFPKDHCQADIWGSIEYLDYLITTSNNLRIYISGGGPYKYFYNNIVQTMDACRPNVLFRQASTKYTPEEFASVVNTFRPQLVLPLHQDGIERKTMMTIQNYVDRVNDQLEVLNANCRMFNPSKYQWYELSMNLVDLIN